MIEIRRIFTHVEQIQHEFGPVAQTPLLRGAIAAVLTNPFAGRYEPDILPMMDELQPVGLEMAQRLRAAMGVPADHIEGYGKAPLWGRQESWNTVRSGMCREATRCVNCWAGRGPHCLRPGPGRRKTGQPANQQANALSIVPSTKKWVGPVPRWMCR